MSVWFCHPEKEDFDICWLLENGTLISYFSTFTRAILLGLDSVFFFRPVFSSNFFHNFLKFQYRSTYCIVSLNRVVTIELLLTSVHSFYFVRTIFIRTLRLRLAPKFKKMYGLKKNILRLSQIIRVLT